jgi:hypothetical protein
MDAKRRSKQEMSTMVEPNRKTARRLLCAAFCALCGFVMTGCGRNASEALVDGFFGGISDTVAGVIVGVLTSGQRSTRG